MLGYKKFICNECSAIIYLKDIAYQRAIKQVAEIGKKETGGVIIGRYSSSLQMVYINELSGAPVDSKAGFCWFVRGVKGLGEYLKKKWDYNDEYYLGEWHFHPANISEPSSTDIDQLKKISLDKRFNCKEPILIVISKSDTEYNMSVNVLINSFIFRFYECKV